MEVGSPAFVDCCGDSHLPLHNLMTRKKLQLLFPRGCLVRATDKHYKIDEQRRKVHCDDYAFSRRHELSGIVVGHSRSGQSIRIIKFGQSTVGNYHHTFYEKEADHADIPISAWIKGKFTN